MAYLGDLTEDQLLYFEFTSRTLATGVPIVLAGTPSLAVYKDDDVTQSTAGITLSVSHDSIVGKNNVKIDTSADAFYATGGDYSVVIAAGTVDSNSVVGEVVGTFSIENRSTAVFNDISVADILAGVIEGSITVKQSLQLANAASAGKASGMATTTATLRDLGDTKDRIVATVDSDGNRSAVTRSYD